MYFWGAYIVNAYRLGLANPVDHTIKFLFAQKGNTYQAPTLVFAWNEGVNITVARVQS